MCALFWLNPDLWKMFLAFLVCQHRVAKTWILLTGDCHFFIAKCTKLVWVGCPYHKTVFNGDGFVHQVYYNAFIICMQHLWWFEIQMIECIWILYHLEVCCFFSFHIWYSHMVCGLKLSLFSSNLYIRFLNTRHSDLCKFSLLFYYLDLDYGLWLIRDIFVVTILYLHLYVWYLFELIALWFLVLLLHF